MCPFSWVESATDHTLVLRWGRLTEVGVSSWLLACNASLDTQDLISLKRTLAKIGIDELGNMWIRNMSMIVLEHGEWRPSEDVPEPSTPQEVPPSEPETPPTPPTEEPPGPDEVPEQPPESVAA